MEEKTNRQLTDDLDGILDFNVTIVDSSLYWTVDGTTYVVHGTPAP